MDATAELSIALSRISLWSGNISAIDVAALSFTVLILCVSFFAARDHLKIYRSNVYADASFCAHCIGLVPGPTTETFFTFLDRIFISFRENSIGDLIIAWLSVRFANQESAMLEGSCPVRCYCWSTGISFFLKAMRNFSSFILGKLGSNISMNVLQGPVSLVKAILPTSDTI